MIVATFFVLDESTPKDPVIVPDIVRFNAQAVNLIDEKHSAKIDASSIAFQTPNFTIWRIDNEDARQAVRESADYAGAILCDNGEDLNEPMEPERLAGFRAYMQKRGFTADEAEQLTASELPLQILADINLWMTTP